MSSGTIANYTQAAAVVGGTIAQIVDMKKQREFQEKFAKYSEDQQIALANKIAEATTQTEKLAILSQAMLSDAALQSNNSLKREILNYAIMGVGVLILVGVAAYVIIKRK